MDLMWMVREVNPRWCCKVCSWMCGMWGWAASWGGPPGDNPPVPFPQKPNVWCVFSVCLSVWCVCWSVIGGVYEGEGWLVLEYKAFNFFLSSLWYCVCDEEGQASLDNYELLVCLRGRQVVEMSSSWLYTGKSRHGKVGGRQY